LQNIISILPKNVNIVLYITIHDKITNTDQNNVKIIFISSKINVAKKPANENPEKIKQKGNSINIFFE
jgi:hypothetical protein